MPTTHAFPQYSIREASTLSGLPESTLRYYESIGLLPPVPRDASSKHRVYCEEDVTRAIAVACLNATGMSIEDMRAYLHNRGQGAAGASEQIELLEKQQHHLEVEARFLALRREYVDIKIDYWRAMLAGDDENLRKSSQSAKTIANRLKGSRTHGVDAEMTVQNWKE